MQEQENNMNHYPKLSNPPIIEALIDIQLESIATLSIASLKKNLPVSLVSKFPQIEEIKKFQSSILQGPKGTEVSSKDLGVYGFLLRNNENTKAAQVRVDGFALSHLQPYESFGSFSEEAQSLWRDYSKLIGPNNKILRVVLRYINIIDCQRMLTAVSELGEYLNHVPELPKGVAPEFTGFSLELVGQDPKEGIVTTVRRGLLKNLQTLQNGISIDIEVVKNFDQSPEEGMLWSSIELLRNIKNDIFFDLVSQKKIEEYK